MPNPNFLNLGRVFPGIETVRIARPEQIRAGIERALAHDGPCVVDVWVDRTEDVKPMIPPEAEPWPTSSTILTVAVGELNELGCWNGPIP